MDRQARTRVTVKVKSREMTGRSETLSWWRGGGGVKTTENTKHDTLLVLQVYNVDPPPAAAGRGRRRREQAGPDTAARIRSQSSENMIRQEFNPSLSVPIRHNLSHSVIILSNLS